MSQFMPGVTVIIPTFNRCGDLLDAIDSVRQGTYESWELIVADDGSTDRTVEHINSLFDHRIKVITHRHCGKPGVLRNRAVAQASAKLIAFLDSDDLWDRHKLAYQVEALDRHPTAGWCATNASRDHSGRQAVFQQHEAPANMVELAVLLMSQKFRITTPSIVVRRDLFELVGGFDEELDYCEDFDLWIRLARQSPLKFINQPLTITRYRDDHFPSPSVDVQQSWARVMRKHFSDTNRRVRRCARSRLSIHEAALARLHAAEGRRTEVLNHLAAALRANPLGQSAWREVLLSPLRLVRQRLRRFSKKHN